MRTGLKIYKSSFFSVAESRAMLTGALLASVFALSGCGLSSILDDTNVEIRNAVDSFDRAIDSLSRQSADWQVVIQDLQEAVTNDVQSTIRVELTNISRQIVLGAGAEFRCDADFLRERAGRELRGIRNELAQALNEAGQNPPIPLLPILPPEPVICSVVPIAVDLSLPEARRTTLDIYGFDLRSLPIRAGILNRSGDLANVTASLGIISDYQMVLDLTSGGAALNLDDRQIVFSWDGAAQSVVPILNPEASEFTCETETRLLTGDPQSFIPQHTGGDRDFDGHGPCVRLIVVPRTDMLSRRLTADIAMLAYECDDDFAKERHDFTRAEGNISIDLHELSPGERLIGFTPSAGVDWLYIDNDHSPDLFTFTVNSIVEKAIFVGDTDGDEAGLRTQVEVFFREIELEVEVCGTD